MKTRTVAVPATVEKDFKAVDVTMIAGGHFIHDIFTAFVAPLLPEIIKILQISLTQAGILSSFLQVPSMMNPLIGYLDDKYNARWFMILAPGVTATLLSIIGLAPNYASLVFLFLITGISVAVFHATAPARLARVAGRNVGLGMSFFMAGGELGRTVGPILAVWAVSLFSIRGIAPLSVIGWIASFILWFRFRGLSIEANPPRQGGKTMPGALRFYLPVAVLVMLRGLMIVGLGLFLPTFMTGEGANLFTAGSTLAIYQLAGFAGALAGGTLSDRLGRKKVLAITMTGSSLLLLLFLEASNWLTLLILISIGFLNLTLQPVMLALVQDHFPNQRSMANGIYMALNFIAFSVTTIIVGALGDWLGLRSAFFWCGSISLLALPVLLFVPEASESQP